MRPLDSYPQSIGASVVSVFPHLGPASYVQVVAGAAPALSTGGDTVDAVEAGIKLFDHVEGGLTDSATYRVEVCYDSVSGSAANNNKGQPTPTVRLRWTVVATGAEVDADVDLSAEIVRLKAFGAK